jgi:polysaccharide pyruvyl transferase WcaK-like protein
MHKLIIGYYGHRNFGDDAMLRSIDQNSSDKKYVLAEMPYLPVLEAKGKIIKKSYLIEYIELVFRVRLVVWGGGTCFYGGWKNQLFLAVVVLISRFLKRDFVFYGIGVDDFTSRSAEVFAKLAIRMATAVYPRDKVTYEYLKGLNKNTRLVADPFFATRVDRLVVRDRTVILNLTLKYIDRIALEKLILILDNHFDSVVAASLNGLDPHEAEFLEHVARHHPAVVIKPYAGLDETISLFESAQSYIGYRLHGMICSIAAGTGFLVYNYQDKIRKAMLELGVDSNREITDFGNLDIELLTKPERILIYEKFHGRAIDEIRTLL